MADAFDEKESYVRSDNYVVRRIADEILLIPITQTSANLQKVFSLNITAADVWEMLNEPHTLEELHKEFCVKYEDASLVIWQDLSELMTEFAERDWIKSI